ncbi:threonine/serine exporter family protein [Natroniella sulfidigena]|uniref:threonine/serine ThrE exporter family protein n=1 Tax=Natroniella sulfidigena TaxID=723921 RepID=UPI00200AD59F|nr:threonine/serine exporter family protein [Natroniella sulfidigena]MCK8817432.1 threonine/serine exporter family protein [Natroniella sulfidigena]
MPTGKEILNIAAYAGNIILSNGAETYRAEETITLICKAYGMKYVDSLVTPTGIFISIDDGNNTSKTIVKRVTNRTHNLTKISQINNFSRQLQAEPLDYQTAIKKLNQINYREDEYSLTLSTLLGSLGAATFVILAEANYINLIPAFLVSLSSQLTIKKIGFLGTINFIPELIAGLIAGFVSSLLYHFNIGDTLNVMVISGILPFVPGVSVTNSIRDVINGDLISATSRGVEAILIAISLAIGVAISLGGFI